MDLLNVNRVQRADEACDGALSEVVREVGLLALEHRKSSNASMSSYTLSSWWIVTVENHGK